MKKFILTRDCGSYVRCIRFIVRDSGVQGVVTATNSPHVVDVMMTAEDARLAWQYNLDCGYSVPSHAASFVD